MLPGVTMTIVSSGSLEGALGILEKLVQNKSHWENYI